MIDFMGDVERQYEHYCNLAEEYGFLDKTAAKNGFRSTTKSNEFNAGWIAWTGAIAAMREDQQSKIDDLRKRLDALTLALDQIAYPIPHMQKEAELNGCELNGYWAVKMSEDHTYSKDIARRALEKEQALKGGSDEAK
jgi:hypothetical protein